jgi:PglZ domain
MTLLATPQLVRAKVGELLRVDPSLRAVALKAEPVWTHAGELDLPGGRRAVVRPCLSTLAVRDALRRLGELGDRDVLVMLTDRDATELGDSVTARLGGQQVLSLDRWQQLEGLFSASSVDPALVRETWAVDALIALAPGAGYRPVAGGWLDRDTALAALAESAAGLTPLDLDLAGLLLWSRDPAHPARWAALDPQVRQGLTRWLAGRGGSGAVIEAVCGCLAHPRYGPATLPVGIALAALTDPDATPAAGEFRAALVVRVTGELLDAEVSREWGQAALAVSQRLMVEDPVVGLDVARRAEQLLAEVPVPGKLAITSPVLPSALGLRIQALAETVATFLAQPGDAGLSQVEGALRQVESHSLAGQHAERVARAVMAVRLCRWCLAQRTTAAPPVASLLEAARRQEEDDAWVDVARARVWEGDVDETVIASYRLLCQAVEAERAVHEHRFAELLADHTRLGAAESGLLPVERLLADAVLPLTDAGQRVLLLVLDGMSTGAARELLADAAAKGWVEHRLAHRAPVIAALPSVTRVSRTSLLCGRLVDGDQNAEKAAWAERGHPLFHKAEVVTPTAGEVFTDAVRDAVHGSAPLVGAVVNTIDDTLDKGGRSPWTLASVDRLSELLELAQRSARLVVLTSDHGHVHERGSRLLSNSSGGARYRTSAAPPGPDEVELAGPRVLLGGGRVVAAWNERLRYTPVRNGYHGGASAQEVVIPLALLARAPLDLDGWAPWHHPEPSWWVESSAAPAAPAALPAAKPKRSRKPPAPVDEPAGLFAVADVGPQVWIDQVLGSDVLAARYPIGRRYGLGREHVEKLLRALDARAGVVPRAVVARALDLPATSMPGALAALQRILNIEGFEVLAVDGDTVRLNAALLKTQAGLA